MPATDNFPGYSGGLEGPATDFFAISPSNSQDLPNVTRAIYVGTAGDIAVIPASGGAAVVFKAVPAGSLLPLRAARIAATGTTAADLVGLY